MIGTVTLSFGMNHRSLGNQVQIDKRTMPEVRPYDWTPKWSKIMRRQGALET